MAIRQHIKNAMLPIAMVGGALFYPWMHYLTGLSPYLIFAMLTITYCRLDFRHVRPTKLEVLLLAVQLFLAGAGYLLFSLVSHTVAEGVFICLFIPTATAAPVITAMLGGSMSRLVTFSLLSNLAMAILGPLVLAAIGENSTMTYAQSYLLIFHKVFPLLVLPMIVAILLRWKFRRIHQRLANQQMASFYMWVMALFIVVGSSVAFAINHYTPESLGTMLWLAAGALAACLVQFVAGRRIGRAFGDPVSAAQGLFQKNTVLAIWLALAYMSPIASLAPASYVAWQNIINSWQIARHKRAESSQSLSL